MNRTRGSFKALSSLRSILERQRVRKRNPTDSGRAGQLLEGTLGRGSVPLEDLRRVPNGQNDPLFRMEVLLRHAQDVFLRDRLHLLAVSPPEGRIPPAELVACKRGGNRLGGGKEAWKDPNGVVHGGLELIL